MASPPLLLSTHTWKTFVRPAVRFKAADPDTRAMVEQLMPYFPLGCTVIAGYLDDAEQFWKVNYHWELLTGQVAKALALKPLLPTSLTQLQAIQKALLAIPPDPVKGYRDSKKMGLPHDRTGPQKILERWAVMRDCKQVFRKVVDAQKLSGEAWDLAAAPVAKPGTSKHGTGYALDIHGAGQNALIRSICCSLGATLVFDEKSHVHVEFKQGVVTGQLIADDALDGQWAGWKHA